MSIPARVAFCAPHIVGIMKADKAIRSHANCEHYFGVSRPGKTARDKATGAWKSKHDRNAAQRARDPNCD